MSKIAIVMLAVLLPQLAWAADYPVIRKRQADVRRAEAVSDYNRVYTCTTHHVFGLLTFGTCGGGIDPFVVTAN